MIGDNEVMDSRGVRLLSEISLYVVYRLITYSNRQLGLVECDVVSG